jgi:hypothetical protein
VNVRMDGHPATEVSHCLDLPSVNQLLPIAGRMSSTDRRRPQSPTNCSLRGDALLGS